MLWGDLRSGRYPVGFRTVFHFDRSRSWKKTRDFKGTFSPDLEGRPVQINIWYPALITLPDSKMFVASGVTKLLKPVYPEAPEQSGRNVVQTETFDQVMGTNARAVFVACREAYPYLEKNGGTIVNIGSFFDKLGVKRNLAYCASKAAVGAITRCLAVEWAAKKIRVLNVAPGYIETELNAQAMKGPLQPFLQARVPTGGPGTTADVARLVAALFSEDIPFLTGETIYVDGGQGMAH